MSRDVARKLAFLCDSHHIAPDRFIEDFLHQFPKPRRLHLREWLSGERIPHGRSLDWLVDFWAPRAPGIERFWWLSSFDEFVRLHERCRDRGEAATLRMDRAASAFSADEHAALCGIYRMYRRTFSDDNQIAIEIMEMSTDNFSQERIFTTIYTRSHAEREDAIKSFDGYTYRLRDQYYIMTFLRSSDEQYMRTMYLSAADRPRSGNGWIGVVIGMSGRSNAPVAERVVITKLAAERGDVLKEVRRCRADEVPADFREMVLAGRLEATSQREHPAKRD